MNFGVKKPIYYLHHIKNFALFSNLNLFLHHFLLLFLIFNSIRKILRYLWCLDMFHPVCKICVYATMPFKFFVRSEEPLHYFLLLIIVELCVCCSLPSGKLLEFSFTKTFFFRSIQCVPTIVFKLN